MNSSNDNPVVSVIMPAYNAEKYIEEAIKSVLNQTFSELELLVLDDCSTDGTFKLVSGIANKDSRIQLHKNEKNMGVARTRNKGIDLARGKYIAFLDSDDIWHNEKIMKQITLAENSESCIVYSSYALIDEEGNHKNADYIVPEQTDYEAMLCENVIGCSTVLLPKHIADNYRFMVDYYHEDYVYWMQVLRDGYKARGLQEVLVDYRVMNHSRSGNKVKSACKRWHIYRSFLGMSFGKALIVWVKYVLNGLTKFSKT